MEEKEKFKQTYKRVELPKEEGQKHKTLITRLKSVQIGKYVEQEIEKHLKITPKKISNEIE